MSESRWAQEEFGDAHLHDSRRTGRLVTIADQVERNPGGKVTSVMTAGADLEATYRLIRKSGSHWPEVNAAATRAAFRRTSAPFIYVPVDGTSLSLPGAPEDVFGYVGHTGDSGVGVEVLGSIIVDPDGTPVGTAAQHYWSRPPSARRRPGAMPPVRKQKGSPRRPLEEKETAHWLRCCEATLEAAKAAEYSGSVWFQMDRGADSHDILEWASGTNCWVTIRACQDRTVAFGDHPRLWEETESKPVAGTYVLDVRASPSRQGRVATMEVRIGEVCLALRARNQSTKVPVPFLVVLAREVSPVPADEDPIEWLLLTSRPGTGFEDACAVVKGYAMRWRIEDTHKTWKTVMKVEETNLRSTDGVSFWAAILWAVAVRIERLKHLARTSPASDPAIEFTAAELMAIVALKRRDRSFKVPNEMTLAQVVTWIAELGGYVGFKRSGGPPGSLTMARGFQRVEAAAAAFESLAKDPKAEM